MFGELYHARVLELAAEIPHLGRLEQPHGASTKVSRICGSVIRVELSLENGAVAGFAIEPRACALGQAVASVLARHALGAAPEEIRAARDALKSMLEDGGPPPGGRFWELRHVEAVRDYPARHLSTMLAFEAAVAALEMAEVHTAAG